MAIWAQSTLGEAGRLTYCLPPRPMRGPTGEPTLCQQYPELTPLTADKVIGADASSVSFSANEKDPAGPLGILGWSGQTLIINGTLIVNDPTWFLDCTVKMGPGARIVVQSDQSLLAWFSRFFACNIMWEGIKFDLNSSGSFGYSQIEDANIAIHSTRNVPLVVINNRFNRNFTGILSEYKPDLVTSSPTTLNVVFFFDNHFTVTSSLNALYAGQTPKEYTIGIHLIKSSATLKGLSTAPNRFSRLGYGIYSLGESSVVQVEHAVFMDQEVSGIHQVNGQIGIARCSFKDNYFTGITGEQSSKLTVKNCNFDADAAQYFGVLSEGPFCHINSSRFNQEADHLAAIHRIHEGLTEISNNYVHIASSSDGIVVEPDPASGVVGSACDIVFDTIVINPWASNAPQNVGIHVIGGSHNNFSISSNRIDIRTDCGPHCNVRGIVFEQCSGGENTVSNNEILNTNAVNTGMSASQAIFIRSVQNGIYCLNRTTDTYEGMTFFGMNIPARIELNVFNRHNFGLVVDGDPIFAPAVVGPQFRAANAWVPDGYKMLAAVCTGDPFLSLFLMHSPLPLYFPPPPFIFPPTGWFWGSFGPIAPVCARKPNAPEAFETAIADGSYYGANATALSRWELDRMLYYNLLRRPDYGADNPVFAAFFAAKANTTAGKFARVEHDLYLASGFSAAMLDELEDLDARCDAVLVQLEQLEDTLQVPTSPQGADGQLATAKEALLEALRELSEQRAIILAQADSIKALQLASIRAFNASIAVTEVFEQNQKALNELAIKMALHEPLTNSDLEVLSAIAGQPDTVAGTTRWRAASWLSCQREGEVAQRERQSLQRLLAPAVAEATYRIVPNPASDMLTVYFAEPFTGQITLQDVSGRVFRAQYIQVERPDMARLAIHDLPAGIYYLRLQQNGQAPQTYKIIIAH